MGFWLVYCLVVFFYGSLPNCCFAFVRRLLCFDFDWILFFIGDFWKHKLLFIVWCHLLFSVNRCYLFGLWVWAHCFYSTVSFSSPFIRLDSFPSSFWTIYFTNSIISVVWSTVIFTIVLLNTWFKLFVLSGGSVYWYSIILECIFFP